MHSSRRAARNSQLRVASALTCPHPRLSRHSFLARMALRSSSFLCLRSLPSTPSRTFTSSCAVRWALPRPSLVGLPIDIHPEVAQAQAEGRAIVALESTLITHGYSNSFQSLRLLLILRCLSRFRSSTATLFLSPARMRTDPPLPIRRPSHHRHPQRPHQSRSHPLPTRRARRERFRCSFRRRRFVVEGWKEGIRSGSGEEDGWRHDRVGDDGGCAFGRDQDFFDGRDWRGS
jgi:hypothetical protein